MLFIQFLKANVSEFFAKVKPSTVNVFIKIKHYFVKINLQSPIESYQLITFANHRQTGSVVKVVLLL